MNNMTLNDLVQLVEKHTDAYLSFPFNGPNEHETIKWYVMKHQSNHKIIALIFEKDQRLLIDLKLTPEHGEEMRKLIGVEPGYHMNKKHWNTVDIHHTDLSQTELVNMIKESARLTA